jgi:hypothetical protein
MDLERTLLEMNVSVKEIEHAARTILNAGWEEEAG